MRTCRTLMPRSALVKAPLLLRRGAMPIIAVASIAIAAKFSTFGPDRAVVAATGAAPPTRGIAEVTNDRRECCPAAMRQVGKASLIRPLVQPKNDRYGGVSESIAMTVLNLPRPAWMTEDVVLLEEQVKRFNRRRIHAAHRKMERRAHLSARSLEQGRRGGTVVRGDPPTNTAAPAAPSPTKP